MGIAAEKEKIHEILEKSVARHGISKEIINKVIEYKYKQVENELDEKNVDIDEYNDSLNSSTEESHCIDSQLLDVKNIKLFPYIAIGALLVEFPLFEETYCYICFAISTNVIVTLASNLEDNNKGGKAKSIITSFSDAKIKWENVYIQNEYNKENIDIDKNNNLKSKLAVILYEEDTIDEWIGVEMGKKEDFEGRDINAVFFLGLLKKDINEGILTEENYTKNNTLKNVPYLREINVNNSNPFKNPETLEKQMIVKRCPGSPCYYKDFNGGAYVIAIINEFLEFQYFDRDDMFFLANMVDKGRLLKKKTHKTIDEEYILKLDLSRNNFSSNDIQYLTSFDLKNLIILDLSYNSIGAQGAFY